MTTSSLLDAALEYAQYGWYVFPVYEANGTACTCNNKECTNEGKHPRTKNGHIDASIDPEVIKRWWGMWPSANIGINCRLSGLVAIDIDPHKGGTESYGDLKAQHGISLIDTISSDTGGGGNHFVFRAPPGIHIGDVACSDRYTGPLGPGVDVRAMGYFIAPPSNHVSGNTYEWYTDSAPSDRPPAPLPDALIGLLGPQPYEQHEPLNMADILDGVPSGERDWKLFLAAAKLRGAGVPLDWAYRLVEDAAANCNPPFPAKEARKKVDSAYKRYPEGKAAIVAPDDMQRGVDADKRVLLDAAIKEGVPPPEWLEPDVLVRGKIHLVYGEPESGKTILATHWIDNAITSGQPVLFIDEESGIISVSRFFSAMGVEHVDHLLHYFPFPSLGMEDAEELIAYAAGLQPALIVFDSLTDMLTSAGLAENDGGEVTQWMLAVAQRLARSHYAPAVVLVDHVTKDRANTTYSVASRAKKAKSDVLWFVDKEADFDQTKTALVHLYRHKNRPGVLPKTVTYVMGGEDGLLVCRRFDATQASEAHTLTPSQQKVLDALRSNTDEEGMTVMQLRIKAGVSDRGVKAALKILRSRDMIEVDETPKAHVYWAKCASVQDLCKFCFAHVCKCATPPKGVAPLRAGFFAPSVQTAICIDGKPEEVDDDPIR